MSQHAGMTLLAVDPTRLAMTSKPGDLTTVAPESDEAPD